MGQGEITLKPASLWRQLNVYVLGVGSEVALGELEKEMNIKERGENEDNYVREY